MSTQKEIPNALRLADWIESDMSCNGDAEIAAELRAQHELIQTLTAAIEGCIDEAEEAVTRHILSFGEKYKPARIAAMRKQVADARAALAAAEAHK
jgi:hypothetical protein